MTKMIEVRADNDRFVFECRVGTFENSDHVVSSYFVAHYVGRQG
jgi:hypothetical protein